MIKYQYDKEDNILTVEFKGEVSVQNMIDHILWLRENKELPQRLKILSVTTDAKWSEKVGRNELISFLEENKISLAQREFIYDAYVISGTFETALGILYKELNKTGNHKFEVFSTKSAAINWLKKFK